MSRIRFKVMRFVFVILGVLILIPVLYVVIFSNQDSQIIEGTIQQKFYQEKKCTQEMTYNPALNMFLPEDNCVGPNWIIQINNERYYITEILYDKLEIDSFYSFEYHPLKGMILLKE